MGSTANQYFKWLFIIFLGLLPWASSTNLIDEGLLPRTLLLSSFNLIALGFLWKNWRAMPLFLWLFFGALVLSHGLAAPKVLAWSEFWWSTLRYANLMATAAVLYSAFSAKLLDRQSMNWGILAFALGAFLPALGDLLQALSQGSFVDDIYQVKGLFNHKNLLSSALMLSLPMLVFVWWQGHKRQAMLAKILVFVLVLMIFILRTRGVWLSVMLSALVGFWLYQRFLAADAKLSLRWFWLLGGMALLTLTLFLASSDIRSDFLNNSNVKTRLTFWDNTWSMITENPLTGVGAGQWKLHFPKYGLQEVGQSARQGVTHIQRPHNDYLWLWSEGGPLALIAFLALAGLSLVQGFKNLGSMADLDRKSLSLLAILGLLSHLFFSFTDFPLERVAHNFFLALYLIMPFALADEGKGKVAQWTGVPIALVALLALFLVKNRWQGEVATQKVLDANARQQAKLIVTAAQDAYSDWYQIDPFANPLPYYEAKGLAFTNRPQEALKTIERAQALAPYNILVWDTKAQIYARLNRLPEAITALDTALSISPNFEMALLLKAELHLQQEQFPEALAALNAYPYWSNDQRYLMALARALRGSLQSYAQHGRFGAMMEHLQKSGKLDEPMDYVRAYRQKRAQKSGM